MKLVFFYPKALVDKYKGKEGGTYEAGVFLSESVG